VPLDGTVAGTPWEHAAALAIDTFPWYESGTRQSAVARALYDERALYLQYQVEDAHIASSVTTLNGDVYEDSCVEFFAAPHPDRSLAYFNLEVNACGTFLLRYGPPDGERPYVTPALADRLRVDTPFEGATKAESDSDDGWWVAVELPFAMLSEFTDTTVAPDAGDEWRANFYRCGGETDPQFAAWNPIDAPQPDFHRPEQFGRLRFE
jgi:hypothetical protein